MFIDDDDVAVILEERQYHAKASENKSNKEYIEIDKSFWRHVEANNFDTNSQL